MFIELTVSLIVSVVSLVVSWIYNLVKRLVSFICITVKIVCNRVANSESVSVVERSTDVEVEEESISEGDSITETEAENSIEVEKSNKHNVKKIIMETFGVAIILERKSFKYFCQYLPLKYDAKSSIPTQLY